MNARRFSTLYFGLAVLALAASASAAPTEKAIFAGGCFWCEESAFEGLPGVVSAVSGYTGGRTVEPDLRAGLDGNDRTRRVGRDHLRPGEDLLRAAPPGLLAQHRPDRRPTASSATTDRSTARRSSTLNDAQKRAAEASKAKLEQDTRFRGKIATQIVAASKFYPAEEYHQDYCKVNPLRYQMYAAGCGRAARLKAVWGDEAGGHP